MDDSRVEDDLGEAYDLVEELWTEGQPPSPDWRKVKALASRLAAVAERLDAPTGTSE
jgi:hypothetical protein